MFKRSIFLVCMCTGLVVSAPAFSSPAAASTSEAKPMREHAQRYKRWFDEASAEFGVPVEILQAIAFSETRWTPHITKGSSKKDAREPVVEVDPHPGDMPPVYGIMGLRDDSYFGHSLVEAAKLIGQTPDTLKADTHQNIRGAAALLAQLGKGKNRFTSPAEWESAVAQFSGIPQPETAQIYSYEIMQSINLGRDTEGYKVNKRPLDLDKVYGKGRHKVLSAPMMVVPINEEKPQ